MGKLFKGKCGELLKGPNQWNTYILWYAELHRSSNLNTFWNVILR